MMPGFLSTKSTTIIGNKPVISSYINALEKYGVNYQVFHSPPDSIARQKGYYRIEKSDQSLQSSSLVVIPKDEEEKRRMMSLFENQSRVPQLIYASKPINPHHNGAFLVSPGLDETTTAPAIASAIALWLNQLNHKSQAIAVVDPSRCRGCGTCVEICEFGAPEIIHHQKQHISWIDPAICKGCGICTAHCPSDAISAGYSSDSQIETMISAIFST
jgi:Pyruvate/2-oxoacid:ferredoxin oxidoreductase delta subunit